MGQKTIPNVALFFVSMKIIQILINKLVNSFDLIVHGVSLYINRQPDMIWYLQLASFNYVKLWLEEDSGQPLL